MTPAPHHDLPALQEGGLTVHFFIADAWPADSPQAKRSPLRDRAFTACTRTAATLNEEIDGNQSYVRKSEKAPGKSKQWNVAPVFSFQTKDPERAFSVFISLSEELDLRLNRFDICYE